MATKHGRTTYFIEDEGFFTEGLEQPLPAAAMAMRHAAPPKTERVLRFSRMFPRTAVPLPDVTALKQLGGLMKDGPNPFEPLADAHAHPTLPAGFTYLGQFIDHDTTFNNQGIVATEQLTVEELIQERTPSLDLDSLYGRGPELEQRNMYIAPNKTHFRLGDTLGNGIPAEVPGAWRAFPNDLPRHAGLKTAEIGDPRNDENLLVAQTHVAFLKFHNAVADKLAQENGLSGKALFTKARRLVTLHYQWIVLHDFLPRIIEPAVLQRVQEENAYNFPKQKVHHEPTMPVEFSVAAYRLGHSMVRREYNHNRIFPNAPFTLLFEFTGKSGNLGFNPANPGAFDAPGANGLHLPSNWIINWKHFYDFGVPFNHARKLDTTLIDFLHTLPDPPERIGPETPDSLFVSDSLAGRNLLRGRLLSLPTGQEVAGALSVPPLSPAQVIQGLDPQATRFFALHSFDTQTPLWYYILKEAEVLHQGERMGPVGSLIIAKTFVDLIKSSRISVLTDASWRPHLPAQNAGDFTMVDLLNFVQSNTQTFDELNPLGDAV